MPKYAVFFRNVNLGQGKSPSKAQLEAALAGAGGQGAASFLTNGTAVFIAADDRAALRIVEDACVELRAVCGLEEPAFTCAVALLVARVAADPFAGLDLSNVYLTQASFLPAGAAARLEVPSQSPRGDVEVVYAEDMATCGAVFSLVHTVGQTTGSSTAFLEKTLQVPVTTRNWNTVVRLVKKFG